METRWIDAEGWRPEAERLKADNWWLADLCGVDASGLYHPGEADHRFEIVVQLIHHARNKRATLHVKCTGDPPTVASVSDLWPTADFMEREAWDMFGINFEGHPNLTRILMPDEWEGHPLRKDYGVGKVAIEFREQRWSSPESRETEAGA